MAAISVKSLALFVLIGFSSSLAAVSDGCTSDADCSSSLDEFCCNSECVERTSDCCSKDFDCFDGESCCNHKCKLDCGDTDDNDDGDIGNTVKVILGVVGGIIFIIWVAFCVRYYRKRRLRYILIIEETRETTVPIHSHNTGQPPSYQQGYLSAPPPYTPPSNRASEGRSGGPSSSYGTIQKAGM